MVSNSHLVERVAALTAPLLPVHSSILVGLSGGLDSVVLLHILHKLAPRFSWQLSALHVHHGISPNADVWADFCSDLCAGYHISLHIERVDIAPLRAHGIEAAARKLRHAAFAEQSCDFVAVAHHADDQAETLLLQLLRGAGVRGASAMPVLSTKEPSTLMQPRAAIENIDSYRLIRPLLHCTRAEIHDYAITHKLHWIEDESNKDDSYPRNFLRHRVLPLLNEKFPACRETLVRSAQHFAEASILLDALAQKDAALATDGETLAVDDLMSLGSLRAKNLLRYFLHSRGASLPQSVQLDDMLRQLCHAREDAAVCIAYGDWEVRRYQGKVYVLRSLGEFDRGLVMQWHGEDELIWPALNRRLLFTRSRYVDDDHCDSIEQKHQQGSQGSVISQAKLQRAPVTLRLRRGGETLRSHPKASKRTLKNLLQERRVPPWFRDRLPLLYCGDELVCVADVAVASDYLPENGEAEIHFSML